MANPTLAELRSLTQGYLNEARGSANALFPDADIDAELNNAAREAIMSNPCGLFMTSDTANAVTGWVSIPSGVLGDLEFHLVVSSDDRRGLEFKTAEEMDRNQPNWRNETADYPTAVVGQFDATSGFQYRLYPQPNATIPNGLARRWTKDFTEVTGSGTFALIDRFPQLQRILLPAGALKNLLMLEGGEADDQAQKWAAIFNQSCVTLHRLVNRLFKQPSYYGRPR